MKVKKLSLETMLVFSLGLTKIKFKSYRQKGRKKHFKNAFTILILEDRAFLCNLNWPCAQNFTALAHKVLELHAPRPAI